MRKGVGTVRGAPVSPPDLGKRIIRRDPLSASAGSSLGGKLKISKALGASLLAAALTAGPVCAATAAPAQAATVQAPATSPLLGLFKESNRQAVIDVFDKTNEFRAAKGLKPLKFNADIAAMSQRWTDRMSTVKYEHNPDFTSPAPAGWLSASENIAMSAGLPSGGTFVTLWANSPGHNVNMSRPDDGYLGIGISNVNHAIYTGGLSYATQNFFQYREGVVLKGSYNHPRDFFNGLPELPSAGALTSATPKAPTWDTARRTYTIPDVAGVQYVVGSRYEVNMLKAPGTYAADDGFHSFAAVAKSGYGLTTNNRYWQTTFPVFTATAKAPVFNTTARTFTIPAVTGVQYLRDGNTPVKAGVYSFHDAATITATATRGYVLAGTAAWNVAVPLVKVTPKDPTFDKTAGTYTIPAQAGVQYIINYKPVAAGTYKSLEYVYVSAKATNGYTMAGTPQWTLRPGLDNVDAHGPYFADYSNIFSIPDNPGVQYFLNGTAVEPGRFTGSGKVTVTATAKAGFRLNEGATSWSYNYAAPTFSPSTGTYKIPAQAGAAFFIDGKAVNAGTYKANGLKVTVTAKATGWGSALSGITSWSYDFRKAVTPTRPAMSYLNNKYRIPAQAGVAFFVDGKPVTAGLYTAVNGQTLKFTTKAAAPTYRLTGTTEWSYRF